MVETLTLTTREQQRTLVISKVDRGKPTAVGEGGGAHGNRGRKPAHTAPTAVRQRVVALARERYAGLNDTHLTEKLTVGEADPALARERVADATGRRDRESPHAPPARRGVRLPGFGTGDYPLA